MRKTVLCAVLSATTFAFIASFANADSATWDVNPGSGDWNTAGNWTPATVPNGSADTATFDVSNTTNVSIFADTEVNGISFTPSAPSYTITARPNLTLTFSGAGITNNSAAAQNFATVGGGVTRFLNTSTAGGATINNNGGMLNFQAPGGSTDFANSSTAGSATIFNNGGAVNGAFDGGFTRFLDSSSAANGTFINNVGTTQGAGSGITYFYNSSTAANGTFTNNGITDKQAFFPASTQFSDTSTAANGTFTNKGATVAAEFGGFTEFFGASTAANGVFANKSGSVFGAYGGFMFFSGVSTAANGTFVNSGGTFAGQDGNPFAGQNGGGSVDFDNSASAGNGLFVNNGGTANGAAGGSTILRADTTGGNATMVANGGTNGGQGGIILFEDLSTGGTSRIEAFGNGSLDVSRHAAPGVSIGSIEGSGNVFLGDLTVGSNNLSTTFSGVIQDGGENGGRGGTLTKIGSGTLDLTGTNTYTGNTYITGGTLKVDGSITSNTEVFGQGTLAGTGTVYSNVFNFGRGTVSPADVPGTLTIESYRQAGGGTLEIDIAGSSTGQFSVLNVLGNANLDGVLNIGLLNGFVPTIGESFKFMDYSGLTGAFLGIQDPTFDNGLEHWSVTYLPTSAILTVESGPGGPGVTVGDHGSTLLLLTLGVLALVTYQRQSRRKRA